MKSNAISSAKSAKVGTYITIDPDTLGGEPVFRGTRVPVGSLFDHLESNCSLDEFLENFPSVSRSAAVGVLMLSHQSAIEKVRQ
jgi:uncharacterized protein (DUF433 family)